MEGVPNELDPTPTTKRTTSPSFGVGHFEGQFSHLTGAKPLVFGFSVVVDDPLLIASYDLVQSVRAELMQQLTALVHVPIFLVLGELVWYRLAALFGFAEFMDVASYGHVRNIKFF